MGADLHSTLAVAGDGTSLPAILQAMDSARAVRPNLQLALATLVNVEGSSYRQPGARLLIDAEARVLAGAISGGCLEGDVATRAVEVCQTNKPVLLRYDLREDLETIWGFGAGCDGVAYILLEPLADDRWMRNAHAAMMRRHQAVLVTSYCVSEAGVELLTHAIADGMEDSSAEHVAVPMRTQQPFAGIVTANGNTVHVLGEPLSCPVALHLIGAGKSAEAFATMAVAMGWQVTVVDHRESLLESAQLPAVVQRLVRRPDQGVADLPLDARTTIALLTHIFEIDVAWLQQLLPFPVAYVGVLGSRSRAARLVSQLSGAGETISPDMQQRLFAPIGLDLGGETPESIALAGIAEMEAVLHSRPGGFLRSRQSPIHTRTPVPLAFDGVVEVSIDTCTVPQNDL